MKPGDIVHPKADTGITMVVDDVNRRFGCHWFVNGELRTASFSASELTTKGKDNGVGFNRGTK